MLQNTPRSVAERATSKGSVSTKVHFLVTKSYTVQRPGRGGLQGGWRPVTFLPEFRHVGSEFRRAARLFADVVLCRHNCRCKGLDSWSKGVDRRSWGLDRWSRCVNGSSCCLDCWSRCLHRQGKGVTAAAGTAVTLGPLHDHPLQRMGGGSTASLGTIGVEMSMPCGPQSALGRAMGITDHGSGGLDHGSGGLDHGSGALAHGSGGLDHGSGGPDHASGALPAHSDTAVLTG
eukprot:gene23012-biopygen11793